MNSFYNLYLPFLFKELRSRSQLTILVDRSSVIVAIYYVKRINFPYIPNNN
jgi:hypothetical protein